ncbi:MAG: hypothetical protein GY720_17735 [bacterium]|nr:hypothetical protein [bacterium]
MTSGPAAAIEAVISRVDWIADRGSLVMRAGALFAWLGAAAATVVVFSRIGGIGWVIGLVCLIPGWILWRYGRNLAAAFDGDKIRGQLGEVASLAKGRLGEVVDGIQDTRRRQFIRGGFKVLKTVRSIRTDLEDFGIDISGIMQVANPGSLVSTGVSLLAALGLWAIAAVGALVQFIF